jgi:hypothetical protein
MQYVETTGDVVNATESFVARIDGGKKSKFEQQLTQK